MKKTTITIAALSLLLTLIATAVGQDRRRVPEPKRMNKPDLTEQLSIRSNRQRNRRPAGIGNPIGLGGTVSSGITQPTNQGQRARRKSPTSSGDQPELQIANPPQQNLGDTGTHEVGHKGRRSNARRSISNAETAGPKGITLTSETYPQEHIKNPGNDQQGARKAVPAPTPSPATVRKGGPKTTNFSWGASQTGTWRTKQPRRP